MAGREPPSEQRSGGQPGYSVIRKVTSRRPQLARSLDRHPAYGSRGYQGPLDVGSGSGQALRSGRVLRSFCAASARRARTVRATDMGLLLDMVLISDQLGGCLTGRANAATVAPVFIRLIAPRAREASVQISPLSPYGLNYGYSLDSRSPPLVAHQSRCRRHGAGLRSSRLVASLVQKHRRNRRLLPL